MTPCPLHFPPQDTTLLATTEPLTFASPATILTAAQFKIFSILFQTWRPLHGIEYFDVCDWLCAIWRRGLPNSIFVNLAQAFHVFQRYLSSIMGSYADCWPPYPGLNHTIILFSEEIVITCHFMEQVLDQFEPWNIIEENKPSNLEPSPYGVFWSNAVLCNTHRRYLTNRLVGPLPKYFLCRQFLLIGHFCGRHKRQ